MNQPDFRDGRHWNFLNWHYSRRRLELDTRGDPTTRALRQISWRRAL